MESGLYAGGFRVSLGDMFFSLETTDCGADISEQEGPSVIPVHIRGEIEV